MAVKMKSDDKEVEKTFKLAETIEYVDSAGKVAAADIFTSGDMVLIFEREGTHHQDAKEGQDSRRQAARQ